MGAERGSLLEQAHALPTSAGIYRFLNSSGYPSYIGKSINIKERVLSHIYAAKRCRREQKIIDISESINYQTTAGELSALLLESELVKTEQPLLNRRLRKTKQLLSWQFKEDRGGYLRPTLEKVAWPLESQGLYLGLYTSKARAREQLLELAGENRLCQKRLNLEKASGACFGFQINRCQGACTGDQSAEDFNRQLRSLATNQWIEPWPFESAIAIVEAKAPHIRHIVHQWFYFGAVDHPLKFEKASREAFFRTKTLLDRDQYRILLRWLTEPNEGLRIQSLA